jgi:hypothetical protein
VQYLGYDRILAAALRSDAVEARQRGVKRWLAFALAWQSLVIVAVFVYAILMSHVRRSGATWVAPPIGALLGTALPYQLAASRLIRGLTR